MKAEFNGMRLFSYVKQVLIFNGGIAPFRTICSEMCTFVL